MTERRSRVVALVAESRQGKHRVQEVEEGQPGQAKGRPGQEGRWQEVSVRQVSGRRWLRSESVALQASLQRVCAPSSRIVLY